MPIILNLDSKEYFISNNEDERTLYLKKLLKTELSIYNVVWAWGKDGGILKSVIAWNRDDKIVIVPQHLEDYVLEHRYYNRISLI